MPPGALLIVELDDGEGKIVALDTLGCGEGERVIISEDDGAADLVTGQGTVVDAIVVGSLDKNQN